MSILTAIGGLFAKDAIQDTVLDLVRDVTGLDELTERERLEHERKRIELLTEYQRATKHQSTMRRFIAFCTTSIMVLFVVVWLVSQIIGTAFDIKEGVYLAARVKMYYEELVLPPTMLVFAFYFGTGAINSLTAKRDSSTGSVNGKPD